MSKALVDRGSVTLPRVPAPVPGDASATSAGGLDPDISPQSAERQVARVAAARHLSGEQIGEILQENTSGRLFGLIDEPRVNVFQLNLALDATF